MKKFLSVVLAIIMMMASTTMLFACTAPLSEVEKILKDAAEMTHDELVEAAKAEIGSNKLKVSGITSGITRAAESFTKKYGIATEASTTPNKDFEQYKAITDALDAGEYYADVVLVQDANSLKLNAELGNFYNYLPNGFTDLAEEDKDPLAAIYFNKLFIYKQTVAGTNDLTNVWQLAGKSTDAGHISALSFQNPTGESINMNFLITLTSPEGVAKLKTAYKAFYNKDYVEESAYKNIGYKFISEFIANVSTWHTSDTNAVKHLVLESTETNYIPNGTIVYAPLAKYKDAGLDKSLEMLTATGLNYSISGFDGFMYKMYLQVLKTAKYPLAASLFITYMVTDPQAFDDGWRGDMGYYNVNTTFKIASGDQSLAFWRSRLLIEDGNYIYNNYDDVSLFVKAELNK